MRRILLKSCAEVCLNIASAGYGVIIYYFSQPILAKDMTELSVKTLVLMIIGSFFFYLSVNIQKLNDTLRSHK